MRNRIIAGLLFLGLGTPVWAAADLKSSAAEDALHALVDRQDAIIAAATKAGPNVDMENVRTKLQQLEYDFETYLKRNPQYGPGFAAYGLLLGKVDMRKESAASFSKANQLLKTESENAANRTPAFMKTWAVVKNQLGNYTAEEGHPIEAVGFFLDAIELVPKEPLYHFQLGKLLSEARDDFLKDPNWSRAKLDEAIGTAFRRAAELAPDRVEYGFRYGQSFYEIEKPDWDAALKVWAGLEEKADTAVERETMRLQAANVLIHQEKLELARTMLATITESVLQKRKEELLGQAKGAGP